MPVMVSFATVRRSVLPGKGYQINGGYKIMWIFLIILFMPLAVLIELLKMSK